MSDKLRKLKDVVLKQIKQSSLVFIVGHNNPDYDSIGSSLGLSTLAKSLGKKTYIIVDDSPLDMDPGVKKILDESREEHNIITLEEVNSLVNENSLLFVTDVNKQYLIAPKNDLNKFKNVFIIDHHEEDEFTIHNAIKYIDTKASSASEIITQVLNATQTKYKKEVANYLLAGIILDTKRFMKNTTPATLDAAEKLFRKGADYDAVNRLFIANYIEDKMIYSLIFGEKQVENESDTKELIIANTHVRVYKRSLLRETTVSYTLNRERPKTIYRQVDLAKTADKMLKYADVSVVMGYTNEYNVGLSARSKCDINVGNILKNLQTLELPEDKEIILPPSIEKIKSGGGNQCSAGGCITASNIFAVEQVILDLMMDVMPDTIENQSKELVKKRKEISI